MADVYTRRGMGRLDTGVAKNRAEEKVLRPCSEGVSVSVSMLRDANEKLELKCFKKD